MAIVSRSPKGRLKSINYPVSQSEQSELFAVGRLAGAFPCGWRAHSAHCGRSQLHLSGRSEAQTKATDCRRAIIGPRVCLLAQFYLHFARTSTAFLCSCVGVHELRVGPFGQCAPPLALIGVRHAIWALCWPICWPLASPLAATRWEVERESMDEGESAGGAGRLSAAADWQRDAEAKVTDGNWAHLAAPNEPARHTWSELFGG